MATQVPPKKNTAFTFYVSLVSRSSRPQFQANPTLAAGDVKVAIGDGAPANLTTLPAVDADFTKRVKVDLSASEMNGDIITVIFSDAAGDEWDDLLVEIHTSTDQIDDLALSSEITALNDITAAEVWAYASRTLTQGAAAVAAAVDGSDITVYRGTTWSIALTDIGALSSYTKVYFTAKLQTNQADTDALVQVYNDTDEGLTVFAGAAPVSIANGVLTIDDAPTGDITITVAAAETASATLGIYRYDVKGVTAAGVVNMVSAGGKLTVVADITRTTT